MQPQLGKDVEFLCLKMFVKGLTNDLNAQEAAKKDKTVLAKIEARMARGFWLMSEIVEDRYCLFLFYHYSIRDDRIRLKIL